MKNIFKQVNNTLKNRKNLHKSISSLIWLYGCLASSRSSLKKITIMSNYDITRCGPNLDLIFSIVDRNEKCSETEEKNV